jgi:hypothetical protein
MREIFCGDFVYFSSHVVEETKIDAGHLQLLQKQTASLGSSLRSKILFCFAVDTRPDSLKKCYDARSTLNRMVICA